MNRRECSSRRRKKTGEQNWREEEKENITQLGGEGRVVKQSGDEEWKEEKMEEEEGKRTGKYRVKNELLRAEMAKYGRTTK